MRLKFNRRFAEFLYFIIGALTITAAQAESPRPTTIQPTQIDSLHGFFLLNPGHSFLSWFAPRGQR